MNGQPTIATDNTKQKALAPPALSDSYLPAVMQAVAYYVELLQYEVLATTTLEPPFSTSSTLHLMDPTTQKPMIPGASKIPATTTPRTTTTSLTTSHPFIHTTPSHKPGNFAPIPSAVHQPQLMPSHPMSSITPAVHQPSIHPTETADKPDEKPLTGSLPLLSISTDQFFSWFLQMKEKQLSTESGG